MKEKEMNQELSIQEALGQARETMAIMIEQGFSLHSRQRQEELIDSLKARMANTKISY